MERAGLSLTVQTSQRCSATQNQTRLPALILPFSSSGCKSNTRVNTWTMKVAFRLLLPLILLLIFEVNGQRKKPPRKPTRRPPEPVEPTELPPPLPPGPPSVFPDCPRECFCPPDFPSALYCDSRNLRKVPIIPSRIHYLYLQNNFIEDLPEESFKNATELKWVNLDNNRIKKVDKRVLEKLDNLVFLYMEKNKLREVPNFLPPNLEQLRLSRNHISKIPAGVFNKLQNLVLLDLHKNELDDMDFNKNTFKGLKNLMQLNLAHNTLRKLPPGVPSAIHQLFLDRNFIEDIPSEYFKSFPNLAFLRLNYNKITDKGLHKNCFNLTNLLVLHLAYNNLTSVPFISSKLEHLYLNNNSIDKINGTQICPTAMVTFQDYPSSEMENVPRLRYLRLDGNRLKPPIPLDLMLCFRLLQAVVV
uniref:Keratocan n=1 Tax=Crocodylus porosus TaxID=8502 RepID=A0A7M4EWD4_CROPO